MTERRGFVFILCAPSGTGKSTLAQRLRAEFPDIAFSLSHTTRDPRPGETPGADYTFVDVEEFVRLRDQGFFAEWAEVHGNFYGTPLGPIPDLLKTGRDVLFDIDVAGAAQLRERFPDGRFVFLLPPSMAELRRRLEGRETDGPEVVARRLRNASDEMAEAHRFDNLVVNDDLDAAYDELRAVYLAERSRAVHHAALLKRLQRDF